MGITKESDAITRLKRGDIGGLEVLVQLYQSKALESACLITRDYAMAEDLVQSAFLRIYERIHQLDSSRPFGPWFIRSVVNSALNAVTGIPVASLDIETDEGVEFLSPAPDMQDTFEAAETREEIFAALEQLPPRQRAAIVLRYYLDLSDKEIAASLEVPPGTVRRRLHDARQRLKHLLPSRLA